jgi:cardiolipin synthase (CMP-forming)
MCPWSAAVNLPTLITLLRLVCVPVVIWLIDNEDYFFAFWIFLAAGVSDAIDGYLARKWDQRTELGAYLDAIADKALLVSIYISLAINAVIPPWLAIAVVSRDVMIIGAVMLSMVMDKPMEIAPLWISKVNTVAQIGFATLVLAASGYGLALGNAFVAGAWLVAALTVASAFAYLNAWMNHMTRDGV